MKGSLEGRRVVVTGASRGIGLAVAASLAEQGAHLILVARSSILHDVAARLPGGPHQIEAMDVRDADAWERSQDRLAPDGLLHGIVTAAGIIGPVGPIGTWDVGTFRETIDVNLTGTLLAIMTGLSALRSARGSIVTFSGGGATAPLPLFDAYAASKAALVRLTENLSVELADDGVRVNSIAPGFVVTQMHDATLEAGPELAGADYFERTRVASETGRGDSPQLAAELATFLLSDASSGISGKLPSARWDPWRDPIFQDRLRSEMDLATLRRIDDQYFTVMKVAGP
jgi:NAD(P)-dependent dehydrogenase (short-subunit alcohol dehydrogenase family)